MELCGEAPDVVIGCVGGGSNFAGIAYPFLRRRIREGIETRFVAAEPAACPTLTRGRYAYDFGDTVGMTPLMPMYTLGHDFVPPPVHAGGLRYQATRRASRAGRGSWSRPRRSRRRRRSRPPSASARCEGIIPGPEPAHAIRAVFDEAEAAKHAGEERVALQPLGPRALRHVRLRLLRRRAEDLEMPAELFAGAGAPPRRQRSLDRWQRRTGESRADRPRDTMSTPGSSRTARSARRRFKPSSHRPCELGVLLGQHLGQAHHHLALLPGGVVLHLAVDHVHARAVRDRLEDLLGELDLLGRRTEDLLCDVDLHRVKRPRPDAEQGGAELGLASRGCP